MGFIGHIKEEFQVIQERDPAIKSPLEVLLYPSFRVMIQYRRAHKLYEKGHYFLARWISQRAARKTGIEIHPGAKIGKGLFIDHGAGVIIGETAIIGDNVTLYQGVTLGGTGKETGKRHPTLKDNVMVSAGAKILGSFTIGENSKIGAGSVVLEEVPPNCTVVGVPGRVVRRENKKVPRVDMDQVHLPNPTLDDIHILQRENEQLRSALQKMSYELQDMREKEETYIDEDLIKEENKKEIYEAIGKLKKSYQIVIYLKDIEGLKYKEISRILNKTVPQLKMMTHRARKSLEKTMRKEVKKNVR